MKQLSYEAKGVESWVGKVLLPFEANFYFMHFNPAKLNGNVKNYYIDSNEPLRSSISRKVVLKNKHLFDKIFTTDERLLHLPNAVWFPLGQSWLNGTTYKAKNVLKDFDSNKKIFSVSFLMTHVGSANRPNPYRERWVIWNNKEKIKIPKEFYGSIRKPLNDGYRTLPNNTNFSSDKIILYHSMFNICPENFTGNHQSNFSQRLVDCFVTKTIPIYFGYPKIGQIFNKEGMVCYENGREAIAKINQLTPEFYYERKDAIEENYKKCKPYTARFRDRLIKVILNK